MSLGFHLSLYVYVLIWKKSLHNLLNKLLQQIILTSCNKWYLQLKHSEKYLSSLDKSKEPFTHILWIFTHTKETNWYYF